ncbi:MAG: hypothetical protein B6240_09180 [Desulfobacteraceae bacterium 4572_87]|nr:MAG: hypothetical protein B6240_09180 [Desulfobacteraceae bacterium 4572_87]
MVRSRTGDVFRQKECGPQRASGRSVCNPCGTNIQIEPLKAFKDFPGSMPYHGAFSANSERVLIPHVNKIREKQAEIISAFDGEAIKSGDFSMLLYPFPKIAVCAIFYLEDEEFPPSATCLFSSNALDFMPLDGLADVAEYTSGTIIRMVSK